jgi:1,4-dihydroxy-2-naphthoate octaprenyltransferase
VIFSLYGIGLIISLYLTWLRGIPVLIFSALGVILGVFYTADPVKLKHRSVGEISVFLAYGPLMVGGAYYALTGVVSLDAMMASVPIGLLVALVLLANNIRDREFDASVGISTLTTNKEEKQGFAYYKTLLSSAYIATIVLIFARVLSPFSIIAFLTLRESYGIVKQFGVKIPLTSDQITAQLSLHYGVLLTLGEFLNLIIQSLF